MTRPGIEPEFPVPLANTLLIRPMALLYNMQTNDDKQTFTNKLDFSID